MHFARGRMTPQLSHGTTKRIEGSAEPGGDALSQGGQGDTPCLTVKQLGPEFGLQRLDLRRHGPGVTISSSAAHRKLPSRAAASKARSALSEGNLSNGGEMDMKFEA